MLAPTSLSLEIVLFSEEQLRVEMQRTKDNAVQLPVIENIDINEGNDLINEPKIIHEPLPNVNESTASLQGEVSQPDITAMEKMCPICCLLFNSNTTYLEFEGHVVEHFVAEEQPDYEVL